MGRVGYKTGGNPVPTAYKVSQERQERIYWAVKRQMKEEKKEENFPTKGPKMLAIEAYKNGGIDKLNEYFVEMNRRLYPQQISKNVVLTWVKDIIKPEDAKKFGIRERVNGDDDAR